MFKNNYDAVEFGARIRDLRKENEINQEKSCDSMDSLYQLELYAVGDRIRECRKASKLSQEKLAEKMEVSSNTISSIENGQQFFGIDKLDQFTHIFNVTTEFLMYGIEMYKSREYDEEDTTDKILEELGYLTDLECRKLLAGLKASRLAK